MRVKLYTLGCKVNQYEAQALIEQFQQRGHQITKGQADLYVVNTCTVTSRADSKSKEKISRARKENPSAKIAIAGCLAQLDGEKLKQLDVDYVIPQDKKASLVDIVCGENGDAKDVWLLKIANFSNQRAFVKIQDGCDNFCSFCRVSHARGPSRSRDKKDVLDEVRRLSLKHREIVLCAVNLGLYGRDLTPKTSLEELVCEVLRIDSLDRLRLSSLESDLVSDGLISLLAHPKLCPHLHLPFQSGDDKVLSLMNKRETVKLYEDVVEKAREVDSDVAISCDIMVGFPGEDENTFKNTIDFLKRVKPMRMHVFSFSARPNTPLAKVRVTNQRKIKKRYDTLQGLHEEFSREYARKFIEKKLFMVAEEREGDYTCGYTQNYIRVHTTSDIALGSIVPVSIADVGSDRVLAKVVS